MPPSNAVLDTVADFADKAHGSQKRKYTPERYIVHPKRVMALCHRYTNDIAILSAALLHDVLEDTPVKKQRIHDFLIRVMNPADAERALALVVELTDLYTKAAYPRLNRKMRKSKELQRLEKTSADSQTVKYADIIDNCKEIVSADPDFAGLFLSECKTLLRKLQRGNQELYREAVDAVDRGLSDL